MDQDMTIKPNPRAAKFFDLGQRLFSLFLSTALPAITTGAVVQKLAQASVDGGLSAEEIREAFGTTGKKKK